ncbi:tetratricopeptide repeat protein [Kitasatospora sp. NPDC048296]|uniref:tetratricopeptide repeat protein n=1 Tax=Kitasatospora sp. NPDC048296 TaxID=3364048 RepID=UPI00371110C6
MIQRLRPSLSRLFRAAGAAALLVAVLRGLPASTATGCAIGFLVGQEPLSDLWFLLTHRLCGGQLYCARYGRGRKLWSGSIAGVPVELGLRPTSGFVFPWGLRPVRAPRLRLWLAAVALFGLHAGLGAWLATSCTGLPRGIGFGLLVTFVMQAVRTASDPVDSLWVVFVMPFRPGSAKVDLWSSSAVEAERLLNRGRISEAHRAMDEGRPALLTPAGIALAEGRYAEAQRLALEDLELGGAPHPVCYIIGMSFIGHTDAGEISPELAAARLDPFLARWGIHDPARFPDFLPTADLARFRNDPHTAIRVARRLSTAVDSPFRRAQACCSLAAALIAAGRPEEAREALARAREECPELARIADVERLLEPQPAEL